MFSSLADVVKANNVILCIQRDLYDDFLVEWPETRDVLKGRNSTSLEILENLKDSSDDKKCDAAIISGKAFEAATAIERSLCANINLLNNEELFSVDNVIVSRTFPYHVPS